MMVIASVVWVEGLRLTPKTEVVQELLKQEESSTDITSAGWAGARLKGSFGPSELHIERNDQ